MNIRQLNEKLEKFLAMNEISDKVVNRATKKRTQNLKSAVKRGADSSEVEKQEKKLARNLDLSAKRTIRNAKQVSKDGKDGNVKEWYLKQYPTDEIGKQIDSKVTFEDIYNCLENGEDIYPYLADDSVVREYVLDELSKRYGVNYDTIYNMWLNNGKKKWSNNSK